MSYTIVQASDLPRADGTGTATFEGAHYGNTALSFFLVEMPPGRGVTLHRHPCEEVFIVQQGRVTFTVGAETVEASAGQIIIVPANVPHAFTNTGDEPLRQIDILPSGQIITEWLEV